MLTIKIYVFLSALSSFLWASFGLDALNQHAFLCLILSDRDTFIYEPKVSGKIVIVKRIKSNFRISIWGIFG